MAATSYIVLQHLAVDPDETSDDWRVIGTADGATAQAAIKAATNGKPAAERTGTFVAVPARSWKPMSRRVESVEKESWE
jgi:hypothetical protein